MLEMVPWFPVVVSAILSSNKNEDENHSDLCSCNPVGNVEFDADVADPGVAALLRLISTLISSLYVFSQLRHLTTPASTNINRGQRDAPPPWYSAPRPAHFLLFCDMHALTLALLLTLVPPCSRLTLTLPPCRHRGAARAPPQSR